MDIMTIAGLGIITVVLAIQLKSIKPEYGIYLSVAGVLLIFFYSIGKLTGILEFLDKIRSYIQVNEMYVGILLKIIGITYIAEFAGNVCKDAGYSAIGNQIEIFGKLMVLAVSMPILLALLETLDSFLS